MATLTVPDPVPSATEDADGLRKACQGWGTDEKAIISVLAHRTAAQRSVIRQAYQQLYAEDLIKRLQSELSGHFERAVSQWILEPYDREAVMANAAIVKKEVDFRMIVEIGASRSSEDLLKIKQAYLARYNRALEEDVAAFSTGDFRKLLVGLVSSYRYEGPEVNLDLAKSEAKMLKDAIEGKAWSHEDLIRILTTRSKAQLKATVNKYKDDYDKFLTKDLKENPDDKFLSALRAVIKSIYEPHKYFAKVLRQAIHQKGTDEDALTRVIVTRAEFDLKEIQEEFFKRNSVSPDEAIAKVTSGDYKDFILALLGTGKY